MTSTPSSRDELGELSDFLFDLQDRLTDEEYVCVNRLMKAVYDKSESYQTEIQAGEKKVLDLKLKCKALEQGLMRHKKTIKESMKVGKKSEWVSSSVLRKLMTECENMISSFTAQTSIMTFFTTPNTTT
jgi:hypothetical protein